MNNIPHIEETPMKFNKEMSTYNPPSTFLTSYYVELKETSKGEGFWVLGYEV